LNPWRRPTRLSAGPAVEDTGPPRAAVPRRLRIVHVTPYYHPSVGGLQHHVKALSDHLAARGHEVAVFTSRVSGSADFEVDDTMPPRERISGVTIRRFRSVPGFLPRLLKSRGAYRLFRRLLGAEYYRMLADGPWCPQAVAAAIRFKPDVVMVASAEHEALLLQFSQLRRLSSARLVALPLLHLEHEWSRSALIARSLSAFDVVLANTEHERAFIDAACERRPDSRTVGVGVDPEPFQGADGQRIRERHGLGDAKVVGYVARLEPDKGVIRLIEAMRGVWPKEPDTRLLLAGHRFKPGSSTDCAVQASLAVLSPTERSRVTVLEGFSEADKASIFGACDVFALPSVAESFGIVYLEAWLCAKPVIGARIGAVQCVIDEGQDGFLVDPRDPAELCEVILRLIRDPELCRRLGRRGREKTMARFTWSKVADAVEAIYLEAVERGGRARHI